MPDRIEGVFIYEKEATIGTGHTAKKVKQKMYCLAKETDKDEVEIRYLGANDEPLNIVEKIPKEEFIRSFTFQPYYFERKAAHNEQKVNKHILTAEEHARRDELYSAEFEFNNALKLDEENLRANFGVGNVYLKMGEKEKAREIFVKISKIDAIFEEHNKHFFNECGIQLRKQELYEEALDYYKKALEVSPQDENLFFNVSRAHFEKGDVEKAQEYISKALEINPEFKEGKAFISYMTEKQEKGAVKTQAQKEPAEKPEQKPKEKIRHKESREEQSKGFVVKKIS